MNQFCEVCNHASPSHRLVLTDQSTIDCCADCVRDCAIAMYEDGHLSEDQYSEHTVRRYSPEEQIGLYEAGLIERCTLSAAALAYEAERDAALDAYLEAQIEAACA